MKLCCLTSPATSSSPPLSQHAQRRRVRGIDALRAYWTLALEKVPDLHFELLGVYTGIDTLVLNYRNQAGGQACEVLTLRGDLVSEGHATYLGASAQAGGAPTTSGR